jgi:hypothetical protein
MVDWGIRINRCEMPELVGSQRWQIQRQRRDEPETETRTNAEPRTVNRERSRRRPFDATPHCRSHVPFPDRTPRFRLTPSTWWIYPSHRNFQVRWLSGRKRRFAKALYLKRVPRVRIPPSPMFPPRKTAPELDQQTTKVQAPSVFSFATLRIPTHQNEEYLVEFLVECSASARLSVSRELDRGHPKARRLRAPALPADGDQSQPNAS